MKSFWRKISLISLLSIAFAYIESAIVVYLREIYYPNGFEFPLKILINKVAYIEIGRELATIVLLFSIAFIAGKNLKERVNYFFFTFGVWDIFYYIWLKVFLNWPSSLMTWDILFLIPVPWTSPVLAPVLVSLFFILISFFLLRLESLGKSVTFCAFDIGAVLLSFFFIILSFTLDFKMILKGGIPSYFNWYLFAGAIVLGVVPLFYTIFKKKIY